MPLQSYPQTLRLFSMIIVDSEQEQDVSQVKKYSDQLSPSDAQNLSSEMQKLLSQKNLPLDSFGAEANRWFGSDEEARDWLQSLAQVLPTSSDRMEDTVKVLDSNGTELLEDDSVTVIKDLKVKGGSSDLKRGTIIKKIHLIGDPENIECRVNGSTLVLKTMFLKKC
jgi:protein PhnA